MGMILRLFRDETIALRLDEIVANLGRLVPSFTFLMGKSRFSVPGPYVTTPQTHKHLNAQVVAESEGDDEVFLFTEKPYDNNYFWDVEGKHVIVSLFGWDHLTALPRNNGAVYFVCALLVRCLRIGFSHREKNTGCINDFWQDKTGVDIGMRTAFICGKCLNRSASSSPKLKASVSQIQGILADLATASRSGMDICDYWKQQKNNDGFDVFICHNSQDKDAVRLMNRRLQKEGISTWLDEEQLPPGRLWQDMLEEQLETVRTAAVFVGDSGVGPWQHMEVRGFLQQFVRRRCPVIPVILSECASVPELPLFLNQLTWVDFRKKMPDPFSHLLWGITGERRQQKAKSAAKRKTPKKHKP
jgi:hypothetical protein